MTLRTWDITSATNMPWKACTVALPVVVSVSTAVPTRVTCVSQ